MPRTSQLLKRQGAMKNFPLNLEGVFVPRTNLSHANLERANLSHADCRFVDFTGAKMKDAILKKAKLQGAILTAVKGLTWDQLDEAIIDETTVLPDYLAEQRTAR